MPVRQKAHQAQFWLTPPVRTRSVTRFGVSVEKVVATREMPSSHQGRVRPERKNSWVPVPARRETASPMLTVITAYTATIAQSRAVSCMGTAGWVGP